MVASAQGVDISRYQKVWTVAEIAALDFVFMKATEGLTLDDANFVANWSNAKAAGKPRGAYHFLHPDEDPRAQALKFTATVKAAGLHAGDMLVVDSEWAHADVDAITKTFLDTVVAVVGKSRHPILVYTMHEVGQHLIETAKAYPNVWFAYPSNSAPAAWLYAPWKSWKFWQWGQSGNVDRDAYDGTAADLDAWIKTFIPVPKVIVPDVLKLRWLKARKRIIEAGLKPLANRQVPRFHTSRVYKQWPEAGHKVDKGSTVHVYIRIIP